MDKFENMFLYANNGWFRSECPRRNILPKLNQYSNVEIKKNSQLLECFPE